MTDDDLDLDLDLDLDNYLLHPQPQHSLRIVHAFMQTDRTIEHVCEETVPIENGTLLQEKLIWCIKQQQRRQREQCSGTHFKLRAMFLYNMDLPAVDMQDLLRAKECRFLIPISALDDVVIKPSIPMFARLNALHILYQNDSSHSSHGSHNHSKKRVIQIHLPHRKHKHTKSSNQINKTNSLEI